MDKWWVGEVDVLSMVAALSIPGKGHGR